MLRYTLCVGDEPDTGGHIEPIITAAPATIKGHPVAFIGGKAFCNACRTFGSIAKTGGPYRGTNCGKEIALDGDVLLCRCIKPPRLVAKMQSISRVEDQGGATSIDIIQDSSGAKQTRHTDLPYGRLIILQDQAGLQLSNQHYRITVEDGQVYEGITNEAGETTRIYADFAAEFSIELMA